MKFELHTIEWRRAILKTFKDLMRSTTINGCIHIVENGRHWTERIMWLIVSSLAIAGVVYFVLQIWVDFVAKPTATTIESTQYPIWEVPFPAIAICPVNKISKKKAEAYAEKLANLAGLKQAQMLELVHLMGRIYDHDIEGQEQFTTLQNILDTYDVNNATGMYDISEHMIQLSPQCEDMLSDCSWDGYSELCGALFSMRPTMEGLCCTFNYVRGLNMTEKFIDTPGPGHGLIVTAYPDLEDYYYPIMNTEGFTIHIFSPNDYPDMPSGGLTQKIVAPDTEVFLRIDASTVKSVPDVAHFSTQQKGCIYQDESVYSYSNCLVMCRVRSIFALCGCKLFYLPDDRDEVPQPINCTLQHIQCLNKYMGKLKWRTLKPRTDGIPGLEHEEEDSLNCPECWPQCSSTSYLVQGTWAPMIPDILDNGTDPSSIKQNKSLIRVFYGSSSTMLYRKDVLYYWYEIVSNFGGICSLFVGFSLMSVVEVLYFFTVRLCENLVHDIKETHKAHENIKNH
ncbi:sodium channel protein Nach-like, partial [Ctenocephalides felis]|uniref:sodium channel protein Nach-like n=1 Tax=Ctenocephalides felis TaxID=7515 RepID=UPI000E6E4408